MVVPDCNYSDKSYVKVLIKGLIDHFTVVCLVAWPLNESEAGVDIVFVRNLTAFLM